MAYIKTVWKNREVERPRTFTITNNPDGTITLTPAEGQIIEPGTPIIAANMNNIEAGIEAAHTMADEAEAAGIAAAAAAETAANQYTDQEVGDLAGDGRTTETVKGNTDALTAHLADYTLQVPYAVATGSANAYSVTLSPAPTSLVAGLALAVKINIDNTGASTINVNGLGAKAIKKPNGNDVAAGNLKAGSIYSLRYNGTNFILQGSDAAGNATPGDVLSGKIFSSDAGTGLVGTMPNQGAKIITPSTANQTIPAGYHNGQGYVVGDADLVAANIRQGVNIFGVTGTYTGGGGTANFTSGHWSPLLQFDLSLSSPCTVQARATAYTTSSRTVSLEIDGVVVDTKTISGSLEDEFKSLSGSRNVSAGSRNVKAYENSGVNIRGFTLAGWAIWS